MVKALSWASELVKRDLGTPRLVREVTDKLVSGLKNVRRPGANCDRLSEIGNDLTTWRNVMAGYSGTPLIKKLGSRKVSVLL